jgi:uncharacterized protein (TIGR02452 family)
MSIINHDTYLLRSVEQSIAMQQFIAEGTEIVLPQPPNTEQARLIITKNRSFEAARQYAEQGYRVAVLNFASSTNPGGGVISGASAQEECLCRVSTLYSCLKAESMWDRFYEPHRKTANPLHNDDIIYTKDVLIFKDDDYQPLEKPFMVDVITCAAPTLREKASNRFNPYDGDKAPDITSEELLAIHEKRGRKIISAAAVNGAQVLILGAFGCGAFRNDPKVVAQAYKNILPDYLRYFNAVEFAVYCRAYDLHNYNIFKEVLIL